DAAGGVRGGTDGGARVRRGDGAGALGAAPEGTTPGDGALWCGGATAPGDGARQPDGAPDGGAVCVPGGYQAGVGDGDALSHSGQCRSASGPGGHRPGAGPPRLGGLAAQGADPDHGRGWSYRYDADRLVGPIRLGDVRLPRCGTQTLASPGAERH